MKEADHYNAAIKLELAISVLRPDLPLTGRAIIEVAFMAGFHLICVGCQKKHGTHREKHQRLVSYLSSIGEPVVADIWQSMEDTRNGGAYGTHDQLNDVQQALTLYEQIKQWALN